MFKTLIILALTILSISCQFQLRQPTGLFDIKFMEEKLKGMSTDDVISTLDGFFSTVGVFSEMPAFEACKTYDYATIKDTIAVIQNAMTKNYWGIVSSLYSLSTDAYSIYSKCDSKGFVAQAEKGMADMKANFSQPDYFNKMTDAAKSNMFQIMALAQNMFNQMKAANFNGFGKTLGTLSRLVLVVTPSK